MIVPASPVRLCIAALLSFAMPPGASAAPTWIAGDVGDVSSSADGVFLRLKSRQLPDNCAGALGSWFIIKREDQAMASTFLSFYHAGKRSAVIYSSTGLTVEGYCIVTAYDPTED